MEELAEAIDRLLRTRERVVVAISGFGGSGKSTLATRLRDHYGIREKQVVRLDSFIVNRCTGPGMLGGFDWQRLGGLLADVRAGRRLGYQPNDFDGRPRGPRIDEELPAVVIVEGVRLLRSELGDCFDLEVWIDCPLEVAAARGRQRDLAEGAGEDHLALWDREWVPKDREYFEAHRPDRRADVVLRAGSGRSL